MVALESTIITHGMPWPQNLETARRVEDEVRAADAVPATIAVIDGRLHAGLDAPTLGKLAQAKGVAKLYRADLAACIATGGTGATTVAATMICANLAGIEVFATGGIGGAHRGAETSFDISADLRELSILRFVVEFFRDDERGFVLHGLLSTSQLIALLTLLASAGLLYMARNRRQEVAET